MKISWSDDLVCPKCKGSCYIKIESKTEFSVCGGCSYKRLAKGPFVVLNKKDKKK